MSDKKKFSLKPLEIQFLNQLYGNYQKLTAGYMSVVAVGRLGYTVTENTQFQIDNNELVIWDEEKKQEPVNVEKEEPKEAVKKAK